MMKQMNGNIKQAVKRELRGALIAAFWWSWVCLLGFGAAYMLAKIGGV